MRLGIGSSFLGTGDMQTVMIENELNIKLNKYLTFGGGIGFAKSTYRVFEQASFIQLNSNIYVSPFTNSNKNDFRIGTGLSWYSIADVYQSSALYKNDVLVISESTLDRRNSIGVNVILDYTHSISDKFLVGVKMFSQIYNNDDINSGISLNFGIKI